MIDKIGVLDDDERRQHCTDDDRDPAFLRSDATRALLPQRAEKSDHDKYIGYPDIPWVPVSVETGAADDNEREPVPRGNGQVKKQIGCKK